MYDTEQDFAIFEAARQAEAPQFFDPNGPPIWVARAPGRLDVMGGISDYSGGLVAEMPIAQAAIVGAQADRASGGAVRVASLNARAEELTHELLLPAELFINPVSLLRHLRDAVHGEKWAGYVAGCVALLRAEGMIPKGVGARLLLRSDVPLGAGVSSSAAVEVASMRALCGAFDLTLDGLTLARLCQRVENDVMDAPCGIMDQVTSALGEENRLLTLLCQPYKLQGAVVLPPEWRVFGVDSAVKHSVAGAAYGRVRVGAFMGHKILSDVAGNGFGGHLCNVSPDEYRAFLPDGLPETLRGSVFLGKHGGIFDTVTSVAPGEEYPVRAATEHAIYEMARVTAFVDLLRSGDTTEATLERLGALMDESHQSYTACGLGAGETDSLAQIACDHGAAGAKITGGGSGGTVCVLCRADDEERLIQKVTEAYQEQTGLAARVIRGSSPGAFATDVRQVAAA